MFVKVAMAPLVRLDSLVQQLQGKLQHIRGIAPDGYDQPPFPPPLATRQDRVIKQSLPARRATENHVRGAHLLAQQPGELAIARGEEAKVGVRPALARLDVGGHGVEPLEDVPGGLGEALVDDVDVSDRGAPQHQRQPNVPVGLLARAKSGDGVHPVPPDHKAGGGEGGAEGG